MSNNTDFWLICDDTSTLCHCDWRITIINCNERDVMKYIYVALAIWSMVFCIVCIPLLYYRVFIKKNPIFDFDSGRFFIRPKPIEALMFFGIIFNLLRVLDAVLLVTDALPNPIVRAFLYELPWQFGLCAFSCYLFGIAHTVSRSTAIIENNWIKASIKIDILCSLLITLPFLTNNVCSVGAAIYATQGDLVKAKLFTDILYFLWTAYCFILASLILFFGLRLLNLLNMHIDNQTESHPMAVNKIKNGRFKVRMIMSISVTSLLIFSFIKCMYALFREELLKQFGLNLAIANVWTFDGCLASTLGIVTILIDPKALTPLSMSSSTTGKNSSEAYNATFTSQNYPRKEQVPSTLVYQPDSVYPLSDFSERHSQITTSKNYYHNISETHLVPSSLPTYQSPDHIKSYNL